MTATATISIPSSTFELGQILGSDNEIGIELTQFVPVEHQLVPYFWASGDDLQTFETGIRNDARVATLTALDSAADRTLYRIEWTKDTNGLLAVFANHDILVESATGTADQWTIRLRAHDNDALTHFHNDCRESDIPITVKQVRHNPTSPDTDPYELTPKQREAVMLAFEAGYFDVPRDISLTELGDQLEISRQAASRRMNRGLHSLIAHTLSAEPEFDDHRPATDDGIRERSR